MPLEGIGHVRAADLTRYMRAHGWTPVTNARAVDGYELYLAPRPSDGGREVHVAVPMSDESAELPEVISRVIKISAALDERTPDVIISELESVVVDSIDVRILPRLGGSRLPLAAVVEVYTSLHTLMHHSVAEEQRHIRNPLERNAAAQLESIWVLPAVARSFSFQIESVSHPGSDMMFSIPADPPTPHKTMCRIVRALQQSSSDDVLKHWDATTLSLTAPMCDSLLELHYAVNGSEIEFSHRFSHKYELPFGLPPRGTTRYTYEVAIRLKEIQKRLRPDVATGPVSVSGSVVELKNQSSTKTRKAEQLFFESEYRGYDPKNFVHIKLVGDRPTSVNNLYFSLWEKDYQLACDAHKDGKRVRVSGQLMHSNNKWILDPVFSFGLVSR